MLPSDRVIVPRSVAIAPPDAVTLPLAVTGGQAPAHAPEQVDLSVLSATNRYTVRPDPSVRNVPADPVPVLITIPVAAAGEALPADAPLLPAGLLLLAALPHAAASSATPSEAPSLAATGIRLNNELLILIISSSERYWRYANAAL